MRSCFLNPGRMAARYAERIKIPTTHRSETVISATEIPTWQAGGGEKGSKSRQIYYPRLRKSSATKGDSEIIRIEIDREENRIKDSDPILGRGGAAEKLAKWI